MGVLPIYACSGEVVTAPDLPGIAVSDNTSIVFGERQINDVRLLGGFHQQVLEAEPIPPHSHHSMACPGLKGADKRSTLLRQ